MGAAGVVWGLSELQRRGQAEVALDLPLAARRVHAAWRREPDFMAGVELPSPREAALLAGEAGILLVAWLLEPDAGIADALHAHVVANAANDANELMWGAPGTMLAARALHARSGEERWADAWRRSAEELLRRRDADGLWTQRLYGHVTRSLGAPHGLVGNVLALLDGGDLLDGGRRRELERETAAALARTAVVEDGLATWPLAADRELGYPEGEIRLQWCGGAPGVAVSAGGYLDEELLLAAAELTWRAGPASQEKGAGICHGTAGNGYALLRTFARTGDERWLERARRFAVHALGQVERAGAARGRGRYSLWTGDVGTALYAGDCLDARAAYPLLETL